MPELKEPLWKSGAIVKEAKEPLWKSGSIVPEETTETTLIKAKAIDINELMSDDFDISKHLALESAIQLGRRSNLVARDELISEFQMNEFLKNTGIIDENSIAAHKKGALLYYEQDNYKGLFGSIKEGWKNNQLQMNINDVCMAEIIGEISPEESQRQVAALEAQMTYSKPSWWGADWTKAAAEILPMTVQTSKAFIEYGTATGLISGTGTAIIAGGATVPAGAIGAPPGFLAGFAGGFTTGGTIGATSRAMELETGRMYYELFHKLRDANGNRISPLIAKPVAIIFGSISGLLELAQLQNIIKTIPGGRRLLAKAKRDTIMNLIRSKAIASILAKAGLRYGGHVSFESSVEVVQQVNEIAFQELAKQISNQLDKTNLPPITKKEYNRQIVTTAKQSVKGFSLIALPGNVLTTAADLTTTIPAAPKTPKGIVPPVTRITRILPISEVTPRIDVFEMGKLPTETDNIITYDDLLLRDMPEVAVEEAPVAEIDIVEEAEIEQQRESRIKSIAKPVGKTIDLMYRKAIEDIQGAIDFEASTEEQAKAKESLREFVEKNPDMAMELPESTFELLEKVDVADLTVEELTEIDNEIRRLKKLGRLKSKLFKKQRARELTKTSKAMTSDVLMAKKSILPSIERANALGPQRIFDMLDGGRDFAGRLYNFFYGATNENTNAEILNTQLRHKTMWQKMKQMGISAYGLTKTRLVGDYNLSQDTMLSIYAGWKNPSSQAALRYGGIKERIKGKDVIIPIDDKIYEQVEAILTEKEKLWSDTIIEEYAEHYNRLRTTTIGAENRDLGREFNYTPIRHIGIEHLSSEEDVIAELNERQFYHEAGIQKGFIIDRKTIPPEYMTPVKTGLTKIWQQEVQKQEHYIANALHLKDMRAIINQKLFRNAVETKFGQPMLNTVDKFIKTIANPDFYKTFGALENLSRTARQHVVIAYLAGNVITIAKQIPSLMLYWAHSSVADMTISTIHAITNPRESYNSALVIHPQLSDMAIEREMAEMREANPVGYQKIINAIGRYGLSGIMAMDTAVKTIGINAVYAKEMRKGLGTKLAADKASKATLLTQPGFSPKDRAMIYSTSEFLNWFLQFTNQLNRIYGIATYDIPVAFRNKHYIDAMKSSIALATMAMLIYMINNRGLPEEPDDIAEAVGQQFVASIPIIGPPMASVSRGYRPGAIPPLKAAAGVYRAGEAAVEGDIETAFKRLLEPVAVGAGVPYAAPKNIYDLVKDEK